MLFTNEKNADTPKLLSRRAGILNPGVDMLNGSIIKSLLAFAIPLLLSNVFQHLYVIVDTIIVGHYLGEASLAAVGVGAVIFELLIGFSIGVGSGFGIVVSRSYGAGDKDLLKRTVAGAVVAGALLTVVISVIAGVFMMPILNLIDTPAYIIDEAYSYTLILVAFAVVLFAYNLFAGLLRAIGNSIAPLVFLIISSLLNIGLSILFVMGFDMGLRGAAFATVVAQGVSAVLCLVYIYKKCPMIVPSLKHFRFNAKLYGELLAQGLSMGLMTSVVTLGSVILQRSINALGYLVIAGHVAARRIGFICLMPNVAITLTLPTFVAQNKGANNLERIRKGVRYGNIFSAGWGISVFILLFFTSSYLVSLLSGSYESVIINNGTQYLMFNSPFYMILGIMMNFRFALQGIGLKVIPVISSVIELTGKIIFAFWIVPVLGYFGVIISEPIIWCAMCLQLLIAYYTNPYIRGKAEALA